VTYGAFWETTEEMKEENTERERDAVSVIPTYHIIMFSSCLHILNTTLKQFSNQITIPQLNINCAYITKVNLRVNLKLIWNFIMSNLCFKDVQACDLWNIVWIGTTLLSHEAIKLMSCHSKTCLVSLEHFILSDQMIKAGLILKFQKDD